MIVMRRVTIGISVVSLVLLTLAGCGGKRLGFRSDYRGCNCNDPVGPSDRLSPRPVPRTAEPPVTDSVPPNSDIYDPRTPYSPRNPVPIPEERIPSGNFEPREQPGNGVQENWRPPTQPKARLFGPVPIEEDRNENKSESETKTNPPPPKQPRVEEKVEPEDRNAQKPEARLMPPVDPDNKETEKVERKENPEPGKKEVEDAEPLFSTFPPDIPQFARVKARVYSGEKPFPEGLNWLKDKEFRTILHLHGPTEDTSIARKQFESKGFQYVGLAVSPETLNLKVVDHFNHVITDRANHRIFVFDRDGSLAGPMWYLHFRMINRLSNEQALEKASEHGLRPNATDDFTKRMMLAIQRTLENKK